MADIFDSTILCKKCDVKMQKAKIAKDGFSFRAVVCPKCNEKIIHPLDEQEFHVKMRLVGNSYAVSIPREIINFMENQRKMMDDMVKLCFEDFGRLSLNFVNVRK